MKDNKAEYRSILKATSLFSGVQVINILVSLVRSKLVALFLGPFGMGLNVMLSSTTSLVSTFTNFGLGTSAVKDVTEAHSKVDKEALQSIIVAVKRWMFITGLFGMLAMIALSSFLSVMTFKNKEYLFSFCCLSVTILFGQITSGRIVILQGTRKLNYLARANVVGSILGLLISIPLYVIFGFIGIVPALILTSVVTMIIYIVYEKKLGITTVHQSISKTFLHGKRMLSIGVYLSFNGMLLVAFSYITRLIIARIGGMEAVGLYNAGFSILSTYVGLIFTAMLTEYYPRLLSVVDVQEQLVENINQQAIVCILILAPIVQVFLVFVEFIIKVLYSSNFIVISGMLHWGILSMYFKAASWAVGFVFVPKGDSKLFLLNEIFANLYMLLLNYIGYIKYGLDGLGVSMLFGYVIYFIQVLLVCSKKYAFKFQKDFIFIFISQVLISCITFGIMQVIQSNIKYLVGLVLVAVSSWISLKELDKKVGLKEVTTIIIRRFQRK